MNLRLTWRSGFSLWLAMSVVLWSAMLYADHMSGSAQACHEMKAQPTPHQRGPQVQSEPACQEHATETACCPTHAASAAQHCGSAHECCLWDGEAPPPPALIANTGHSPSKQLQDASTAMAIAAPLPPGPGLLVAGSAPPHLYVKPVQEKKTDLRI